MEGAGGDVARRPALVVSVCASGPGAPIDWAIAIEGGCAAPR